MIEVKNLSKSYRNVTALRDISLLVGKKDIFGIIGLSGAGKSTLIRTLASLETPSSGSVHFEETDISGLKGQKLRDFRKSIGMIFQHFHLLSSRNVGENIAYPLEISGKFEEKRVDELLKLVGLSHKKNVYPSQLSGGEKQRVGIARALANHPKVLLCDEATSALDPKTSREILDLLKNVNKELGITIVLITHDMEVIKRICNKVAVIDGGKIVEEGLVANVFADPEHSITQKFIQSASHDIPAQFFKSSSPNKKLLRLKFKGKAAGEPLIAQISRKFHVEANILLGWIDHLQTVVIGTLIIQLSGDAEGIANALSYLHEHEVRYEVLEHGS